MKSSAAVQANLTEKLVYTFGDGKAEGSAAMKNLLGGKGANLAEMCSLGIPVPAGFTITMSAPSATSARISTIDSRALCGSCW